MKFLTTRELRSSKAEVWESLSKEGELVITNNGKPRAVMVPVTDDTFELALSSFRSARALDALRRAQKKSVSLGRSEMTMAEIDEEIATARSERKASRA